MTTHGPRMTPELAREVLIKLAIRVEATSNHGISLEIHRTAPGEPIGSTATQRWRLFVEPGLTAGSGRVWLGPLVDPRAKASTLARFVSDDLPYTTPGTRGPFWNKGQLEKGLRAWRRGE